jgi:ABC-type dipeptide/oligopeptide/nickel transport system permease component
LQAAAFFALQAAVFFALQAAVFFALQAGSFFRLTGNTVTIFGLAMPFFARLRRATAFC